MEHLPQHADLARREPLRARHAGGLTQCARGDGGTRLRRHGGFRVRGQALGLGGAAPIGRDQLQPGRDRPLPRVRRTAREALEGLGIELTAVHTEAGPGLLELNLAAGRGLEAADSAALVKFAVKEVAASLGMRASFLAKTAPGEEGSSGHVHISCWSDKENAFAPAEPGGELPPACTSAVAGMLEHLAGASLLLNPDHQLVQAARARLVRSGELELGRGEPLPAVRVIGSSKPERCRIECRRPGADANPYLALAALVVSAANGIRGD